MSRTLELDRVSVGTVTFRLHLCVRRKTIYAVIETGGKQYRVSPGQVIEVELDKVLLVASDEKVFVGNPHVKGAKVLAEAVDETRGDKVLVFHFKPKVRERRKRGHRQYHTRLAIKEIHAGRGHKMEDHSGT